MFDVRPVNSSGDLDLERITRMEKILRLQKEKKIVTNPNNPRVEVFLKKVKIYQLGKTFNLEDVPVWNDSDNSFFEKKRQDAWKKMKIENVSDLENKNKKSAKRKNGKKNWKLPTFQLVNLSFLTGRMGYSFATLSVGMLILVLGCSLVGRGLKIKDTALANGQLAYANLSQAKEAIGSKNFKASSEEFEKAQDKFGEISADLDSLGGILTETGRYLPFLSKLTSGKYLSKAGEDIAMIGKLATEIAAEINQVKNPLQEKNQVSFLEIFQKADENLKKIESLLESLSDNLAKINLEDIPEDKRTQFAELKNKLPEIKLLVRGFINDSQILVDVLGGNGPRKYLFLFQNNHEMRATGGFIGTYGVLDIFNGRIKNFFVDGIFNPDGQLREKVVPPAPIQKISAAWSLHDSNWFPDFPTSAEKARWFYEKTGGPTVDGVITMTPIVLKSLLSITGPIEMPEYGLVIDENNFMEEVQSEVEIKYDKELNQPKKILADLAPKILDKLFNMGDLSQVSGVMKVLLENLDEKHILIYANNIKVQEKISEKGWSGEILDTERDYLSVINSNINGYKTDGVIEEKIEHFVQIQDDGSIIDEISITRKHNGGDSDYEWFNKVNANYMRVYVPKGSRLLSAEGQTREFNSPPIDYDALGFKKDPQIQSEEQSIEIDDNSGTIIYDEDNKTVFANWVYVSPKESVTIKYKYLLPFKIKLDSEKNLVDNYSVLFQKQSGSLGDNLEFRIELPKKMSLIWKYPDQLESEENNETWKIKINSDLSRDRFFGVALGNSNESL